MWSVALATLFSGLRGLVVAVLPIVLTSFVVGLFVRAGVALTSMYVVYAGAEWLRDFSIGAISLLPVGDVGVAVYDLLSMFGVFEGISLIISSFLAKATWLMVQPSLRWLTPPSE